MTAEQIRAYRDAKGLTQHQLAEIMGVTPTAVTTWEKGQAPSGPALKLLRFLIEGVHPFNGPGGASLDWEMPLTISEWEELERRRIKNGFPSVRDYVIWRIRQEAASTTHTPKSTKTAAKGKK